RAPLTITVDAISGDVLVPVSPDVASEFCKNPRTIKRWIASAGLGFPRPVRINGRLFVSRNALEQWKRSRIEASLNGEAA
ncbi:helix-turn-helix transcriptional regulator, partial [Roseiarcus sp.]|uniref:helix-turn-helix transcriptional regulator n=1 Tax=Roseiarcus sp. TaxID=1969460 RepID=UPI003F9E79DD